MTSSASQYFARIIRAVIVSSLGFGGGIGLLTFIFLIVLTGKQSSRAVALQAAIVCGTGFGVFWALLLLLSDLTCRLHAAKGLYDEIWELEQKRELEFSGSIKEARALSRQALLAVPNVKAVADEEDARQIKASVGTSWKSAGETMLVQILPSQADGSWTIRCTSTCLAPQVAFDYGKNFENVETWLRTMNKLQGKSTLGHKITPPDPAT